MLEINRAAKLQKLSVGARITDSIDGEGDMRSRRVDPPIRGDDDGGAGLR
jgi:hypothetical protein